MYVLKHRELGSLWSKLSQEEKEGYKYKGEEKQRK